MTELDQQIEHHSQPVVFAREAEILASEQMRDRIAQELAGEAERRDAKGGSSARKQAALLHAWARRILSMPGRLAIHLQEEDMQ